MNHLAPHILMRELRPALLAGAPSRIVTVGSSTSDRARIDPANLGLRAWLDHGWRLFQLQARRS